MALGMIDGGKHVALKPELCGCIRSYWNLNKTSLLRPRSIALVMVAVCMQNFLHWLLARTYRVKRHILVESYDTLLHL